MEKLKVLIGELVEVLIEHSIEELPNGNRSEREVWRTCMATELGDNNFLVEDLATGKTKRLSLDKEKVEWKRIEPSYGGEV